jgi:hypothetical protein
MKNKAGTLIDGMMAGLLGALAVALWFLIFDYSRGETFHTPAVLGAVLLHGLPVKAAGELFAFRAVEYSVVHFAAFALFGLLAAWLITEARRMPLLRLSALVIFAGFEIFFITVIVLWAPPLMSAIPWPAVLVANLIATVVMLTYFFVRNPDLGGSLLGSWLNVVSEGLLAGLLGGAIVAIWFLLFDLNGGQPLRTPAILGAALFGARPAAAIPQTSAAFVLGYTVLHFAAFATFGILAALMLAASERQPLLRLGLVLLYAWFALFFVGFLTLIDYTLLEVLTSWRIVTGNVLATMGMLALFYSRNPNLAVWRPLEAWVAASPLGVAPGRSRAGRR